jgi:putative flippase GtrA
MPGRAEGGAGAGQSGAIGIRQVGWFLVAGGLGFLVDAGMLALLLAGTSMGPLAARVLAILVALGVTWTFNRSLTFGRSRYPLMFEGARYGGVGMMSALVNYGIYAAILMLVPAMHPLVAVAIASAGAMAFSWTGYSRFVFRK